MSITCTRRLGSAFVLVALLASATADASPAEAAARPATEIRSNIGKVIATPGRLGIYYWAVEKRAGGKIKCTGTCAVKWPPVYVKGAVARHIPGVMATFGTIARAGRRQLTVNGLPAYTYRGDTPNVVKCDNIGGWFAVRPQAG